MRQTTILLAALVACLLTASGAAADTLELTDGRIVEGAVYEVDGGFYVLSRYGPSFLKADQVRARTKAKPVDQQIREHLAKLEPDDAENRALLAEWLQKIGRTDEAHAMAQAVLELDPESSLAHKVLGHVRHKGLWKSPDQAKRDDGFEKHGDSWYTPAEWQKVSQGEKQRVAAVEKELAAKARTREVNRLFRLVMSPDPALRSRARSRLEALAKEMQSKDLDKMVAGLDAYLKDLDDLREKASAASASAGAEGMVMGEIRATLSRLKRPIEVFETSLASGPIGANAPVKIQIPELEVIRVRTTGIIPAVVR